MLSVEHTFSDLLSSFLLALFTGCGRCRRRRRGHCHYYCRHRSLLLFCHHVFSRANQVSKPLQFAITFVDQQCGAMQTADSLSLRPRGWFRRVSCNRLPPAAVTPLTDRRRRGARWASAIPRCDKGECELIWLMRNVINQHITSCKRKVMTVCVSMFVCMHARMHGMCCHLRLLSVKIECYGRSGRHVYFGVGDCQSLVSWPLLTCVAAKGTGTTRPNARRRFRIVGR